MGNKYMKLVGKKVLETLLSVKVTVVPLKFPVSALYPAT